MTASYLGRARATRIVFALALALGFAGNYTPQPALAASFTVACNDTAGLVSMINNANGNGQSNTIKLASGCVYELSGAASGGAGLPDITSTLTIDGQGSTITRLASAPAFRIFNVANNGNLTLENVVITHGLGDGAAVAYNAGALAITKGSVIENNAGSSFGAVWDNNSGSGTLKVDASTFRNNAGSNGGAIYAGGSVQITSSTFEGNATIPGSNDGGAIFASSGGNYSIANSTFSSNHSVSTGGALVTIATAAIAPIVNIVNSTFYGNSAAAGGGAIYKWTGFVTVKNSVFENNSGPSCIGVGSGGFNLSDDASCLGQPSDLTGSALLAPLANNGGPTKTHGLMANSPATDSGDPATCAAAPVNNLDQRGFPRPQLAACDRGAFEQGHVYVVDNTADSGAGTLRQAILSSNGAAAAGGAPNAIYFNLPGAGVQTITPASALPLITAPVIVDGLTQPGASCAAWPPALAVQLSGGPAIANGLNFDLNLSNNVVRGLVINGFGIGINLPYAVNDRIECNFIGTNAQGNAAAPNTIAGLYIQQAASGNVIGGPEDSQRNLISGNGQQIELSNFGVTPSGNVIRNNYIGTDAAGNAAVGGGGLDAVFIFGTTDTRVLDNVISGNAGRGLSIAGDGARPGSGAVVRGNRIGVNAAGTVALPNGGNGLFLYSAPAAVSGLVNTSVGGTATGQGNVISGNAGAGISLMTISATSIVGNRIGTNAAGTAPIPNVGPGVAITAGTQTTIVGGAGAGAGNVISGNSQQGLVIDGAGAPPGFPTQGNGVQGNLIGVAADGATALPNGTGGVHIVNGAIGSKVGGAAAGEGNVIANNGGVGVAVDATSTTATVLGNSIYANGGIGIDLAGDGVTYNHQGSLAGPNSYQNYPVLSGVISDGSSTRVLGRLDAPAGSYRIEFFSSPACDSRGFGQGKQFLGAFTTDVSSAGTTSFDQPFSVGLPEPWVVSATATDASGNTSEFSWCIPVTATNANWADAQAISMASAGGSVTTGSAQGYVTVPFGEKWYKFAVSPGARVQVSLTSEPGSALTLHQDPHSFYNQLTSPGNVSALSAATGDSAFLPFASLPNGSTSYGFLPSGSQPYGGAGTASLGTAFLPAGAYPPGGLPAGAYPPGGLPAGAYPPGGLPAGAYPPGGLPAGAYPPGGLPAGAYPPGGLPAGTYPPGGLPAGATPSGSLPAGAYPPGGLPVGYEPGGYTGAAVRSLMAVSMAPNATVQSVDRQTYDIDGDLYVRVVGLPNLASPFNLSVTVTGGVCGGVAAIPAGISMFGPTSPATTVTTITLKTLILTDYTRLPGSPSEVLAAQASLASLANRPDVAGVVVNLGNPANYPRVAAANVQADGAKTCPAAKNMVAAEIKGIVDTYRRDNTAGGKTTLEYIVLAGGRNAIPFIQQPDVAGLANEKEYVPPVAANTPSEAGLKGGRVQGDDGYGSLVSIAANDHNFMVPDLAVGRLVENAADITTAVNTYITAGGVITPSTALVTGYDFVGDAAQIIKEQFEAGINPTACTPGSAGCYEADALIQAPRRPPTDPTAWTAQQLRAKLLAGNHDLLMLSGHFSAGSLLAADYTTGIAATEVMTAAISMTDTLVMALGCHAAFSLPTSDLLTGVSPDPDWAKAFLRRGAAGYVGSTGYAYGSTDLQYWGESLFITFSRQLRTGSGPVALGKALVAAKKAYIAEWGQLDGYDEKTLISTNLYGLPMMKVNMPGQRLDVTQDSSIVGAAVPVTTGPGAAFGLRIGQPAGHTGTFTTPVTTVLTRTVVPLTNVSTNTAVNAVYYSAKDGVVASPFAPVFPKARFNVSVPGAVLRGVALRSGTYTDTTVTPLTQVPSTELSNPHPAFYTGVFYPAQTWQPNFLDAVSGGPDRLSTVPAQFKSSSLGATDGTLRGYSNLSFYLYYMDAGWAVSGGGAVINAGTAAAPSINGVSTTVNGSQVNFTVHVQGDPSSGVQAVWVLYTAKAGPLYGQWQPLDLTQWNAKADPSLWQGVLTLPAGADPADLQFMVQVVSGAGLPALDSNFGAYYTTALTNTPVQPVAQRPTLLSWQSAPSSAVYLKDTTFTLRLTYTDTASVTQPYAGQPVILDVGGQQAGGTTGADGNVSVTLQPYLKPGSYVAQATFGGAPGYLATSSPARSFAVDKDTTSLALTPASATSVNFAATVRDSAGGGLGGKSVLFVFTGGSAPAAYKVTTDYQGVARLSGPSLPPGTYNVTAYFGAAVPGYVDLTDDYYGASQGTASLTVTGQPPAVTPAAAQTANEGAAVSIMLGSFTDTDGGPWAVDVDWGDGTAHTTFSVTAAGSLGSKPHTYADGPHAYTVIVSVKDSLNAAGSAQFQFTVNNVPPTVSAITAPLDPTPVRTTASVSATFSDPGVLDTHTAVWNWGDGTSSSVSVTESGGSGSVSGAHQYTGAGVYTVGLSVTDKDGGVGSQAFQYVVVYDSSGSFVTGGGWINSPAGAYTPNPSLTGKASFGFVAKYAGGSNPPTGSLDFNLGSTFNFKSTALNWLVINGPQAQFQGTGTLNGAAGYTFFVTGIDGTLLVPAAADRIRIKIWNAAGVVYDNQPGAADPAAPTMTLGNGNVKIH